MFWNWAYHTCRNYKVASRWCYDIDFQQYVFSIKCALKLKIIRFETLWFSFALANNFLKLSHVNALLSFLENIPLSTDDCYVSDVPVSTKYSISLSFCKTRCTALMHQLMVALHLKYNEKLPTSIKTAASFHHKCRVDELSASSSAGHRSIAITRKQCNKKTELYSKLMRKAWKHYELHLSKKLKKTI